MLLHCVTNAKMSAAIYQRLDINIFELHKINYPAIFNPIVAAQYFFRSYIGNCYVGAL